MAPPTIPVINIPDRVPWCSLNEFRAREIIMGHMAEAQTPISGNVNLAVSADPNRLMVNRTMAARENVISTFLLSMNFSINRIGNAPRVISPQNLETALAPMV